jgi:UDP-N-acetylmuramate: L-alanyl-gamma-D-glutamyl-meso-diaminopimelate ligase
VVDTLEALLQGLLASLRAGDQVLIMSNGGFGGLHARLLAALQGVAPATGR